MIREAELVVSRRDILFYKDGPANLEGMGGPPPIWSEVPARHERASREELVTIANQYLDTLKRNDGSRIDGWSRSAKRTFGKSVNRMSGNAQRRVADESNVLFLGRYRIGDQLENKPRTLRQYLCDRRVVTTRANYKSQLKMNSTITIIHRADIYIKHHVTHNVVQILPLAS